MIITRLLEKWFKLDPVMCQGCEILKGELDNTRRLLEMVMQKPPEATEIRPAPEPLRVKSIPWSVRQQMLEAEDRAKAKLMKEKTEELEKEILGNASYS